MNRAQRRAQAKKNKVLNNEPPQVMRQPKQDGLMQMVASLAMRVFGMDRQMQGLQMRARKADWRSAAILNLLHEKGIVTTEEVAAAANKVQQAELDQEIEAACAQGGLVDAPEGAVVKNQDHAIVCVEFFKDGQKLEGETVKAMTRVGAYELFPELDEQLRGMKVGDSKKFSLELMNQTDTATVELLGLKRPKEQPNVENQETEVPEA